MFLPETRKSWWVLDSSRRRAGLCARPRYIGRGNAGRPDCVPAILTVNTLVDNTASDNMLSLREAINAVNAQSVGTLDAGGQAQISGAVRHQRHHPVRQRLTGTISLMASSPFALTKAVTITGPGQDLLTLDGGTHSGMFLTSDRRPRCRA